MIPTPDALTLLAAHPATLERFFEVDVKVANGVRHLVVGTSDEQPCVRDSHHLRSFMLKAWRLALLESLCDASALGIECEPERGPRAIFRRGSLDECHLPPSLHRQQSPALTLSGRSDDAASLSSTSLASPQRAPTPQSQEAANRFRVGGARRAQTQLSDDTHADDGMTQTSTSYHCSASLRRVE